MSLTHEIHLVSSSPLPDEVLMPYSAVWGEDCVL